MFGTIPHPNSAQDVSLKINNNSQGRFLQVRTLIGAAEWGGEPPVRNIALERICQNACGNYGQVVTNMAE